MKKFNNINMFKLLAMKVFVGFIVVSCFGVGTSIAAETPQYGGILTYAIAAEPPTLDIHREYSFAVVHTIAPHYSLLLKVDPDNYPNVIGDLAESWSISPDKKTYTFKIRKGVKFHDGSIMTSRDIKATYDRIIFPKPGQISVRQPVYSPVEKVEAPDDNTVAFRLKWPSASFLSTLAGPHNFIYKADILDKNPTWYEKNIMGTGPYKFVEYVRGSHWVGKRNEDYFVKGHPYLDGYRATFIGDAGARLAAIQSGRVHAEFRYFGPIQIANLVKAMGDKVTVSEIPVVSTFLVIFNTEKKPFDDPRVRRALALAVDQWEGARVLSKISNVGPGVGALLRPGSEFAMNDAELTKVAGFSKDIAASRKEARRLLKEAGIPEGFSFVLDNRAQPDYEGVAIWLVDQWRQIGLNVTQRLQELGKHDADLRAGNYSVANNSISDFMDNPDMQFSKFNSKAANNYMRYMDTVLDNLYLAQSREMDPKKRKVLCDQFQKRVIDEMAYAFPTPWDNRIVAVSSKLKGWKALPSHQLNMDFANVWLSKD